MDINSKKVTPLESWAPQEKWVWEKVYAGEIADFNDAKEIKDHGSELDPKKPKGWPDNRIITLKFLETILFEEPYRSAIPRQGVQVIGAWFKDKIDLSNASLIHQLVLAKSRFESDVDLNLLKTPHSISLSHCKFKGVLVMNNIDVKKNLHLRYSEVAKVNLRGARINGELDIDGSNFGSTTDMRRIDVGGNFSIIGTAFEFEVDLVDAKVAGRLDMSGSKFNGSLYMNGINVGSDLLMRSIESRIMKVYIRDSVINGILSISNATLWSLDLSSTRVKSIFELGSAENLPAKWENISGFRTELNLRNAEVGAIEDIKNAWPDELLLEGFTYSRLWGYTEGNESAMAYREVEWLLTEWIEKQKRFSPQPYEQMSRVLRESGFKDKAGTILFAGKQRERREESGLRWLSLILQEVFVGYGYRYRFALLWAIVFTSIGFFIVQQVGQELIKNSPKNTIDSIFYSLDILLPIIKLNEIHYNEIVLCGWVKYYFYVHKMIGYILASFIIAGLSGITKK
jgi:uncharacterized protein YjbI with pentapeptide repeats